MTEPLTLLVFTTAPWQHALSVLRFHAPADALGWRVIPGKEGTQHIFPERVSQADVVLIQRDFPRFFDEYRQIVVLARQLNKPVIYDLDDLLFVLPESHPRRQDYLDALGGMLLALLEADRVIVSSHLLVDIFSPLRPDIVVWPTVLPDAIWMHHFSARKTTSSRNNRVVVGYIGGETHAPDVEMLSPVLSSLLDEYAFLEIHFFGVSPPQAIRDHQRVLHIQNEISSYHEFVNSLNAIEVSIWLVPLEDNLFNRCKSAIKFWEYSALGGAGVYSDIDPYARVVKNGENGFLASVPDEWLVSLRRLIENPELRLRISRGARATLNEYGWLRHYLEPWMKLYTSWEDVPVLANPSLFYQVMEVFSRQIQERSNERHMEAVALLSAVHGLQNRIHELEAHVHGLQDRVHELEICAHNLEKRSAQLDDIMASRSWKLVQHIQKWRRLDFSS